MKQFTERTKYIPLIEQNEIGHWQIDRENDGTPEYLIQFPFAIYSEMVNQFVHDVYVLVLCFRLTFKQNLCIIYAQVNIPFKCLRMR